MRTENSSKHIVIYLASLIVGGTERVVVNLADYLYKRGYRVTIVTTYKREGEFELPEYIERIITEPSDLQFDSGRIGNFRKRISNLKAIWNEIEPDVILSFIGKNNMMALLTAGRIPVCVAVRGEPTAEYYSKMLQIVSKTLFAKSSGIILQTTQSMRYFPAYLRKKCTVLNNPLREEYMQPNESRAEDNRIVTVGRVDENKNQKMLIDAFASIADKYPMEQLVIYGDGVLRDSLIKYVEEIGMASRISLPGATSKVREEIKNAGIFVLTSDTEGMPNALIEAMCLGIPAISTDCPCGGPAELICNRENGMLIPVGDTEALKVALSELLDNDTLRHDIGQKATLIKERLNPNCVYPEWERYLISKMR